MGGFQGVCVFFASHHHDEWGPSLTSLGWVDRGNPAGFGYPNQLALYCRYEMNAATAADIQLPPFHDFTADNPDATWGINHGLCTL